MSEKRGRHEATICKFKQQEAEKSLEKEESREEEELPESSEKLEEPSQEDLDITFGGKVVRPKALKKARVFKTKVKNKSKTRRDEENYIGYQAKDHHTEAGYSLMNNFEAEASSAVLDLAGDDDSTARAKKNQMKWDVKKKKYVRADQVKKLC